MNWSMRRRSLKLSLTNLIKPLLKCRDTKKQNNIVKPENFYAIISYVSFTPVILPTIFGITTHLLLFQLQHFKPKLQISFQILMKSANITNRQKYNWTFLPIPWKKFKNSSFARLVPGVRLNSSSVVPNISASHLSLCFHKNMSA